MAQAEFRADVLAVLSDMLDGQPEVQLGQMMGHPAFYFAPSGGRRRMFAILYGAGVALKLPQAQIAELLDDPRCSQFAPMGQPMRGWVVLGCAAAEEIRADEELLQQALDGVAGSR
jgi:hypothetical protein